MRGHRGRGREQPAPRHFAAQGGTNPRGKHRGEQVERPPLGVRERILAACGRKLDELLREILGPVEMDPAVRDAIEAAVASGITVVEPAGNNAWDLQLLAVLHDL